MTYDSRVNKRAPAALFFKQGQHKGDGCRAEQDKNQLVLELLENEFPKGCGRFLRDG